MVHTLQGPLKQPIYIYIYTYTAIVIAGRFGAGVLGAGWVHSMLPLRNLQGSDWLDVSFSLNSLKGLGDYIGIMIRAIKDDTRSFDYGSYRGFSKLWVPLGFRVSGLRFRV